jgi:sulfite reductase (NADPH) flavoprotein alpha-component
MSVTNLGATFEAQPVADTARGPDPWAAAPFDARAGAEVRALVAKLDGRQRSWLSGYLAGSLEPAAASIAAPGEATPPSVLVLHGSQTGNAEQLARSAAEQLAARHVPHRLLDMLDCRKQDLEGAEILLVVVSTHGDGEPPDRAIALHELLHGRKPLRLAKLRYSVLALGDSSYEKFCETGRQFDARLAELGASRLTARVDCDVDFEAPAQQWIEAVTKAIGAAAQASEVAPQLGAAPRLAVAGTVHTRKNPFHAAVLVNQRLTARGSSKDVRHLELSLEGSAMHYEPGDSLGVVPRNAEADVDTLLAALGMRAGAPVTAGGREVALRDALLEHCEIGTLSAALVRRYAEATGNAALFQLAANEIELARYVHGRSVRDLVRAHPPHGVDAQTFAKLLQPLAPRLYSLSSSSAATPDEAHLTVGIVEYEAFGEVRRGVVSGALAQIAEGAVAPVYLHRNPAFRLPADTRAAIVMIGAGTGIAPFRAFVADREAFGAKGRNWLVFGDRSFELDFLYQTEWLGWRKNGLLTRLDVAFSRDQERKIYVQHRLAENGAVLWAWLRDGAHLYVCGDAARMAPDVEAALLAVVREHGAMSDDDARRYLLELQRARRYQRDVY